MKLEIGKRKYYTWFGEQEVSANTRLGNLSQVSNDLLKKLNVFIRKEFNPSDFTFLSQTKK